MSTSSPVLVEIVSIPAAPILVEEVIALTNRCCTFGCKPGLGMRLHLIGALWNVGLHSSQKPFAKLLCRLVDTLRKDLVSNITDEGATTTPICLGILPNCSMKGSGKDLATLD